MGYNMAHVNCEVHGKFANCHNVLQSSVFWTASTNMIDSVVHNAIITNKGHYLKVEIPLGSSQTKGSFLAAL